MIEHSRSVRMGVKKSLMVVDMPYQTYKNKKEALSNAKKIIKETKCEAVKLEGGIKIAKIIQHLINNRIPVMGHLGVLPQSVKGKFKSKGKTEKEKIKLLKDSKLLENIGAFAIVLECVQTSTSKLITRSIKIPTIGIGSSVYCDGQVLVTDDLLGLSNFTPRFIRRYSNIKKIINKSVLRFRHDVINKNFPNRKNIY